MKKEVFWLIKNKSNGMFACSYTVSQYTKSTKQAMKYETRREAKDHCLPCEMPCKFTVIDPNE